MLCLNHRSHQGRTPIFPALCERWDELYLRISSSWIAVRSLMRGLPLFLSARPKTPLRVLCIIAFDALHVLRTAKPLPALKLRALAALLDFGACANAAFDNKECCSREFRGSLQLLEEIGIRPSADEYLQRLSELESRRPFPGGDAWQFHTVGLYREAVVRLSLGIAAATANGNQCLDDAIRATYCEADLNLLFRIAMQCQIIDDALDYSKDLAAGLPSFLTASPSLPQTFELTRSAATGYADDRGLPRTADVFPLRLALFLVSACTKLAIALGRWRHEFALAAVHRSRLWNSTAEARWRRHVPIAPSAASLIALIDVKASAVDVRWAARAAVRIGWLAPRRPPSLARDRSSRRQSDRSPRS